MLDFIEHFSPMTKTTLNDEQENTLDKLISGYEEELEIITTRIKQTKYPDCNCVEDINNQGELRIRIDWLKSLKERVGNFDDGYKVGFSAAKHNQWKPSDEQMEAFEHFCTFLG